MLFIYKKTALFLKKNILIIMTYELNYCYICREYLMLIENIYFL